MATQTESAQWGQAQEYPIELDKDGRIIDFLDSDTKRDNNPEERIRQRMVQVLHFELGYPKNKMAVERWINIGIERKRADIVIYNSSDARAKNSQGQIVIIGETKNATIKEPDGQVISYISATSAQGGFWTNDDTLLFYRKNLEDGVVSDWLGIPKYGLAWDSVGRFKKSDLIPPIDLKIAFRRCHSAIYRSGIDSEDVALDMVRIILAKVEDESSSSDDCQFHITQEEYRDKDLRGMACSRVRALFVAVKERYPEVFASYEEITASDDQLAIVISYLQQYTFLESSYDVIGTAYEVYVASHLKGERGQYFTNRLVVNMMVGMLDPGEKDIILDPACGSGGFLVASMNYLFKKINMSKRSISGKELIKRGVVHNTFGVDTTPKLVKVAKANMLLCGDGHGGIIRGNSLGKFEALPAAFLEKAGKEKVSIILTNPPFGSGHDLRIKEPALLNNFTTGHVWEVGQNREIIYDDSLNSTQGVAPEVLFAERCIDWVKKDGLIGIVMAKGQLDNRDALAMRKLIFHHCKVLAVVNLHEDTFEPFVGAKASVIFMQKKSSPGTMDDYRIFMAISNKVGQTSRGVPIFKRDSEGKPLIRTNAFVLDEDLSEIAEDYKAFKQGKLQESGSRFTISRNQINQDTLSLNPIQYLPAHNKALQHVLSLGDGEEFEIKTLGNIATVFNGPRFKRPYADKGVTEGPTIRRYFTGTALTQLNSDNIKYLDSSKGTKLTKANLDTLTIFEGYILISDSGTLGRISYAMKQHDGHVATNNLIRVVIEDLALRGYVYQFLKTEVGQKLMLMNAYGTNQEHLEPDVIAEIPIPIPRDRRLIENIGLKVIMSIGELEKSLENSNAAHKELFTVLGLDKS
jgi:type I restriction enzyme M protein